MPDDPTTPPPHVVDGERVRRRLVATLVTAVAAGSTGYIAAVAVGTIAAREIGGESGLVGIPPASIVLGTALGASLLSAFMATRGRRRGLILGYLIAIAGAVVAIAALLLGWLPLLAVGALLLGFGNSSSQLSRYAAADLYPPERRGSAIGIVVWGSTVGAVVGPNLVAPAASAAGALGLPPLAGPYLLPAIFAGIAALVGWLFLRPDPSRVADPSTQPTDIERDEPAVSVADVLVRPPVAAAVTALVVGQVVMVLIMTMTPIHMASQGHGLDEIGLVYSAHTFGMFALSPIAGRLTDRLGTVAVIFLGTGVLAVASVLAAAAPVDGGAILLVALFLLGWGWNLGFVAGSELLTSSLRSPERTRIQGVVDTVIWSAGAAASLGSGIVLAAAGYAALGILGLALLVVPVWVVATRRARIAELERAATRARA